MSPKNRGKRNKIATYALASALVLSNVGFVTPAKAAPNDLDAKIKQFKEHLNVEMAAEKMKDLKEENAKASLKAEDKVRVIVEVEGQTPVEYATKEGKLYKELSEKKKTSLVSNIDKQQKTVKGKIKSKGINMSYKRSFSTAFNGFSGEVTYGDLAKIEAIAGVKKVYLANEYNRPEVKPDMKNSKSFVQANQTWADANLKGEGMIVSVIDTGVDPTHKDFILTEGTETELSKQEVDTLVSEQGLKGKFYTEKVPYGYNYYDDNSTILDLGPDASMHGMHVAGTVAANGDEANGGIKGVAPESQVLAMKVFSNDPLYPSTWSDVYLAAIDDSIKLGADVLNMSLGDTAAYYQENGAEDVAIKRAADNGIVSAVSAGNSGHIANGWDDPFYKNPDIGVVGSPGLNPETIQVAATGNVAYLYQHGITVNGAEGFSSVGYGIDDWLQLAEKHETLELVSLGGKFGNPADYEGVDVKGKVVVMPRGGLTFVDKTNNAAAAGAVGIIVYNSSSPIFYENQGGWNIPFMKISKTEGEALEAAITAGHTTLNVSQTSRVGDPEMGRMTDFTSWGTTPSLELKPEISAPGGKIISTLNNDQYGEMSGTSMAAPHVAGGSALVQQYLQKDERFDDLSAGERTALAKVLLMNTAETIDDLNGQPFSPRRQGAGMMQTYNAVDTPVYFVNNKSGQAKVELKDFTSKTFEMTFTATNVSTEEASYAVNTDVLTDTFQQVEGEEDRNATIAGNMDGAVVTAPETVTVPAGESVDITVKVDLTNAKIPGLDKDRKAISADLKEDIFVEGFVTLEGVAKGDEVKSALPTLTAPYVGFYGNWDNPSIVDGFKDQGETRFFDLTGMFGPEEPVHDMLVDDSFQGLIPGKGYYAISPNGDFISEDVNAFPSFLRNAKEAQFNILDKDGKLLRRVKKESDVVKSYYDGGQGTPYSYKTDRAWDGTVKGETVEDGLYYYEIKTVVDHDGAEYQSKKVPVYVDTTAPKVAATYDPEKSVVSWTTTEEGTGVLAYGIFVDGKYVGETEATESSFVLENAPEKAVIEVLAVDQVFNFSSDTAAIGDVDMPLIYIGEFDEDGEMQPTTPIPYGYYDTLTIPVTGFVSEDIGLKSLKVNGKVVTTKFNKEKGIYTFETSVTFDKEGQYDVKVEAIDHSNKSFEIARKVFIDTTKAELTVVAPERVDLNVDEVTLKINMKDNFNYLSLFVDDNHEYEKAIISPVDLLVPANDNVEVKVPVKDGENKFTLKLTDISGNETIQDVVVNRAAPEPVVKDGWVFEGGQWFYFENGEPANGWLWYNGKSYYINNDGSMKTGWLLEDGTWYLFNQGGDMATGWAKAGEQWYYFDYNGAMQKGWVKDQRTWYYLNNVSGAMQVGWLQVDGKWYHFNGSGAMDNESWKLINNKWYYFYHSGQMAANTVVDGYTLGGDGAWIVK